MAESLDRGSDSETPGDDSSASTVSERSDEAIRAANAEFRRRTADQLNLPFAVMLEQRDAALRQAEAAHDEARAQRDILLADQDAFITFLMEDHETKVHELQSDLKLAQQELERQRALALQPPASVPGDVAMADSAAQPALEEAHKQVANLQQLLEAAYAEVDETRTDAVRLQEERDEAIRAIDDTRVEVYAEVEAARDETHDLQTQLDGTNRVLEDARDDAREQALRLTEELDSSRRELDDRNAEVRSLRQRLAKLTKEARGSQPPLPTPARELETARREAQSLRKQLIDAKRQLSRMSRELEVSRAPRVKPVKQARVGPGTGAAAAPNRPQEVTPPVRRPPDRAAPRRRDTPLGIGSPFGTKRA